METAAFLGDNPEDADLNQYWYSSYTIKQIVAELVEQGGRMAFLSTPSLYFSLPDELRSKCYVFDVSFRSLSFTPLHGCHFRQTL